MTNRFYPVAHTLSTDLQNELVLIHGVTGKAYRFNGTARALYLALPGTHEELQSSLINQFEVSADKAAADVQSTITQLESLGLISKSTPD